MVIWWWRHCMQRMIWSISYCPYDMEEAYFSGYILLVSQKCLTNILSSISFESRKIFLQEEKFKWNVILSLIIILDISEFRNVFVTLLFLICFMISYVILLVRWCDLDLVVWSSFELNDVITDRNHSGPIKQCSTHAGTKLVQPPI